MTRESVSQSTQKKSKIQVHKPKIYKVILLNDDFTPMDFVVAVLIEVFHHDPLNAERIMWQVHREGKATCGTYPRDIAETKQFQVNERTSVYQFPLRCDLEVA